MNTSKINITVKTVPLTKNVLRQMDKTWGGVDPRKCHPIARFAARVIDPYYTYDVALLEWGIDKPGDEIRYTIWMDASMYMTDFYEMTPKVIIEK